MTAAPVFAFGGRPSLDLTWTVRYRTVLPTELLATPADLRRWLRTAGLPVPASPTEDDLTRTRALREAIFGAAEAVVDGRPVEARHRRLLNRCAAAPPPSPVLAADGTSRAVVAAGDEMEAALSALARDAIELLAAHDGRLRRCAGPHCSLLFHDDSRPGRRRWCAASRCGNRVNTRAYRRRQRNGA